MTYRTKVREEQIEARIPAKGITVMRQTVFTQQIGAPAEVVWAFIGDLRNDRVWRGEISEVRLVSGTPPNAPATYEETVEWEGLKTDVVLSVEESVAGKRIVIVSDEAGFASRAVWTFENQGPTTLATLEFSLDATGPMHLVEPFMWNIVSRWLERDLPLLEGRMSSVDRKRPRADHQPR